MYTHLCTCMYFVCMYVCIWIHLYTHAFNLDIRSHMYLSKSSFGRRPIGPLPKANTDIQRERKKSKEERSKLSMHVSVCVCVCVCVCVRVCIRLCIDRMQTHVVRVCVSVYIYTQACTPGARNMRSSSGVNIPTLGSMSDTFPAEF